MARLALGLIAIGGTPLFIKFAGLIPFVVILASIAGGVLIIIALGEFD